MPFIGLVDVLMAWDLLSRPPFMLQRELIFGDWSVNAPRSGDLLIFQRMKPPGRFFGTRQAAMRQM